MILLLINHRSIASQRRLIGFNWRWQARTYDLNWLQVFPNMCRNIKVIVYFTYLVCVMLILVKLGRSSTKRFSEMCYIISAFDNRFYIEKKRQLSLCWKHFFLCWALESWTVKLSKQDRWTLQTLFSYEIRQAWAIVGMFIFYLRTVIVFGVEAGWCCTALCVGF